MRRLTFYVRASMILLAPALIWGDTVYSFTTVINPADPTFDQLLGINNGGAIAGYYGSGAAGHPNQGFTLALPGTFTPENFPGSAQTQVIGINNAGYTDGFYVDSGGGTHGFTDIGGVFTTVDDPSAVLTQLLGLNDSNVAAGYWQDVSGNQFPFTESGPTFTSLDTLLPSNTSAQATDINNAGSVSGFFVDATGTHGFLLDGGETTLDFPGATFTQALGLNNDGQVVGDYTDAAGNSHGFLYTIATKHFQSIDDPNAVGAAGTVINGTNDLGQIVGFYADKAGNTDGFVASPVPEPGSWLLFGTGLAALAYMRRKRTA